MATAPDRPTSRSYFVTLPTHPNPTLHYRLIEPLENSGKHAGEPTVHRPTVVIEAGHSDNSLTWQSVARELAQGLRVISYDRAGYGLSTPSSSERTAENAAKELREMLVEAGEQGPWVLVAHSYGGILTREFFHLMKGLNVIGMVLVDTESERSMTDPAAQWPMEELFAVGGDMDRHETTGLDRSHKLTLEEWEEAKRWEVDETWQKTAEREDDCMNKSYATLGAKRQYEAQALGNRPLSVIKGNNAKDIRMIYEAGVRAGNGKLHQQDKVSQFVNGLEAAQLQIQREQLALSSKTRMVFATRSGHHVHMEEPELIAEEVRWVLQSAGYEPF